MVVTTKPTELTDLAEAFVKYVEAFDAFGGRPTNKIVCVPPFAMTELLRHFGAILLPEDELIFYHLVANRLNPQTFDKLSSKLGVDRQGEIQRLDNDNAYTLPDLANALVDYVTIFYAIKEEESKIHCIPAFSIANLLEPLSAILSPEEEGELYGLITLKSDIKIVQQLSKKLASQIETVIKILHDNGIYDIEKEYVLCRKSHSQLGSDPVTISSYIKAVTELMFPKVGTYLLKRRFNKQPNNDWPNLHGYVLVILKEILPNINKYFSGISEEDQSVNIAIFNKYLEWVKPYSGSYDKIIHQAKSYLNGFITN